MFRHIFITAFLILSSFFAIGQVGKPFPIIETEMISGDQVELPTKFQGQFVLLGVGTSKKAEEDLKTWQQPIYNKFIAKTGIMDDMFNVEVCFIPVFTGTSKLAKDKVVENLKKNNEAMVMNHVYIYSGDKETFNSIGVDDKKEPFFILLNPNGKIVWMEQGHFKQSYFDDIETILTK